MRKKTILEMGRLSRLRNSLGGKTLRATALVAIIISIAALSFGFLLYSSAVRRDYRTHAWQMSKTAARLVDIEEVRREAEQVIRTYKSMSEEELLQLQDKHSPLLSRFDQVRGSGFEQVCITLRLIQESNGGKAAFTAFLDPATNRRIFITDSDRRSSFCPPGSWDEYDSEMIDTLINGKQLFLDKFYGLGKIPATTFRLDPYGYRCMGATQVAVIDGYPVFIIFDMDMSQAVEAGRRFLVIYLLILLAIIVLVQTTVTWRMYKTIAVPIKQLTEAAMAYTEEHGDIERIGGYFSGLDIRTGDEIEKLSLTMKTMETDLGNYVEDLTRITAERERISTELSLATRIQADMLPSIFPAFPDRPEFDIYANMDSAKEVGGDFYDFFLVDEDHLCIVMADVSGKGVPAALFMMASKIILSNNALSGKSPAQILTETNRMICTNNREEMFVTVWLGILEISTGKLTAANAGHEYPVLKSPGGKYELLRDKHGFVIGGMDGIRYKDYELTLEPGTRFFLYTDGVPEATDLDGKPFGMDRMVEALNRDPEAAPEEVLRNVRQAVDEFIGSSEQFDDITMLSMEYKGPRQ